ncbi:MULTISPECIES: hypothetical protein [Streptomyces]|uniref:Uncharacterized protein n=1 Tax=Streptomyces thermoviolaceus subsp. thermoviolaceus TaxID=66860 RepID=A0ABX0YUM2_STRTL|nr:MULTISPECIES: hypothetical protein [Streptomyces]MCM3267047.1 hypothetical protein [Streptomyces thermoviolaceus]NJP16029.1 hypothetical protein [Streptomyces thermoviolaceus subsp. thermoviolaceus]RSR99949.1 hypothetical protein EF917_18075 [Streptomyces sp. WAC00469]WTD48218.1 hypothetical protein OG899_12220 [Streptomyces thermoviolaceus]GGV70691.1 hypothetical protein GCM10010499_20490 [Streptomyces thermoviolaceus subsp. apingens]
MRIRRILTAVVAAAAFAGLGLTGATAAFAESLTPGECEQAGGTVDWNTQTCKGGSKAGQMVD